MRVRRVGCVVWIGLLGAVTARADPPQQCSTAEELDDCLQDCEGLPERGSMRYEPAGSEALYGVSRSGERYLVLLAGDGKACRVYPIGRPAAQTTGRFARGSKVFALKPPSCTEVSCVIALAVRGKGERLLAALNTKITCDDGVELRPIKLFPDHDSIEMVCDTVAAGGWSRRLVLVDIADHALSIIYDLQAGEYVSVSPDERKAGICPLIPAGAIRVEKVAAKPVLRVIDPAAGTLDSGRGMLPARQLVYDPELHEFAPTGAPDISTRIDARDCRRR